MNRRGCAPVGGSCCGDNGRSCRAGQKCCGGLGCAPTSATCCGNGYCAAGKSCCLRNGRTVCADRCTTSSDNDNDDEEEEEEPGIPTIIFPNLDMREIFENMCRGIMKRGLLYGPQTDILTYEGGRSNSRRRRREAGCNTELRCSTNSDVGQTYETRQECDEYPFASTKEGGSGAHIGCVPWWQNSWQGIYFSSWISSVGLRNGDRFRVVLEGIDCSTVPQSDLEPPDVAGLTKRQSNGELVFTGSSANGTWLNQTVFGNLTSNEGRGAFIVPLPELKAGVYNVPIQLNGGNISAMAAYDEDGEELSRQNHTTTSASLSFTIEDDGVNVVAVAWATNKEVQLDYNARRSPLPSTSSSTDVSQSTGTTSAANHALMLSHLFYALTVVGVALTLFT
ncbi:hypothetical protein CPB86DRAFT_45442, partial [Serendipita vermifera]